MGFEYIYAYLENLRWGFWIGLGLSTIFLIFLIIERAGNGVDIDDWNQLMRWDISFIVFFGLLAISPGMDHVKSVRDLALGQTVKEVEVVKLVEKECPSFSQVTPFYKLTEQQFSVIVQ